MKCPKDNAQMAEFLVEGHALDLCPVCSGIWMDWGELRAVAGTRATEHELIYRGASKRFCPKCGRKMSKADLHANIVEKCGCGLFFDKVEAEKIIGRKLDRLKENIELTPKQLQKLTEEGVLETQKIKITIK